MIIRIKLSAYANDADFLASDVGPFETIFYSHDTFQLYSSIKHNPKKSVACWIGKIEWAQMKSKLIANG